MASFFNPLKLLYFSVPWASLLLLVSFLAIGFSGFRSGLLAWGAFLMFAAYFRDGFKSVLIFGIAGLVSIGLIYGSVSAGLPVPLQIQRALSFLPGDWDPKAVAAADATVEWRVEMWREALASDRYIRNKWFGDGFGFRQRELWAFVSDMDAGVASDRAHQEYFLIIGTYHSGPISTIRFAGVVGLILFTITIIAMAVYAWKIIRKAHGTPILPMALFFGIPVIYFPFHFIFIYGHFPDDFPLIIYSLAMLNVTQRSLALWARESTESVQSLWMKDMSKYSAINIS
jgi:hypothetical protein